MGKKIPTGVGIAIVAIVAGVVGLLVWSNQAIQTQPTAQNLPTAPQSSLKGQVGNQNMAQNVSQNQAAVQNIETDKYKDWATYKNDVYKYQFRYPDGVKISEAKLNEFSKPLEEKMSFEQVYKKYTGKICVTLSYKSSMILISAPANKTFDYVLCGRSGVGSEAKAGKSETFIIGGEKYTVETIDDKDEGVVNHWGRVKFSDGTSIDFSSSPGEMETIREIIESYQKI